MKILMTWNDEYLDLNAEMIPHSENHIEFFHQRFKKRVMELLSVDEKEAEEIMDMEDESVCYNIVNGVCSGVIGFGDCEERLQTLELAENRSDILTSDISKQAPGDAEKEEGKVPYWATFAVDARYTAKVEAKDLEEAKSLAEFAFSECDIGDLESVGARLVMIEDEKGNYVYER